MMAFALAAFFFASAVAAFKGDLRGSDFWRGKYRFCLELIYLTGF
jgi:hypothetical protein